MRAFTKSASLVASRYIEAGLLKAPPAMVKEITEWVQDAFSAWLAELPNFDLIEKARELQSVYFSKVREYEKLFGRNSTSKYEVK